MLTERIRSLHQIIVFFYPWLLWFPVNSHFVFKFFPSIHHGGVNVIISGYKFVCILVDPLSYPTSSFQLQNLKWLHSWGTKETPLMIYKRTYKVLLGLVLASPCCLICSSSCYFVCITLLLTLDYHVSSHLFSFVVYFCSCHKCFSTLSVSYYSDFRKSVPHGSLLWKYLSDHSTTRSLGNPEGSLLWIPQTKWGFLSQVLKVICLLEH